MLILSMVSGVWIDIMLLILHRVLAHPQAIQPLASQKRNFAPRRKAARP